MDTGREDKLPWDKWYWQDWSSGAGVQACGFAAKGFWMDLLSIMAKSKIRGKLLDNESKMETKTIAKLTHSTIEEIEPLLAELRLHGVFSEDVDGIIFNRRMARASEISRIRSESGKLGGRPKSKLKANTKSKTKGRSASVICNMPLLSSNILNNSSSLGALGVLGKWNSFAELHGLAEITEIEKGSSREIHLRKLSKKKGFNFDSLLEIMGRSPFLLGEVESKIGGKRFFATFDWVINKTNYQKIIEGNYIDREAEEIKKLRKEREDWVNEEEGGKNGKDDKENF